MRGTKFLLLAGVVAFGVAGCKTTDVTTAVGSTVGGIAGSYVGSGVANSLATSGGVVIGGLVGQGIGEYLDEQSRAQAEQSASVAITTGQPQAWTNPNAGTSGTVVVTSQEKQTTKTSVPVVKEQVQETPPLELVDNSNYVVANDAKLQSDPSAEGKTVGTLKSGETVEVVGQVKGKDYYMVSQGGVATGFVSKSQLEPAPATAPPPPSLKPAGTITQREIATSGVCRTIQQDVTLKDGTTKTDDNVTACQTTDGWQVASAGRQSRP